MLEKMAYFGLILFGLSIWIGACKSNEKKTPPEATPASSSAAAYDSLLAAKYGADEYGMKKYVVALLQRCPKHGLPKDKEAELMQAHLKKHHSAWK